MSWNTLDPHIRELATKTLTSKQLTVLKLNTNGMSTRRIALALDIIEPAARGLLTRAHQRLNIELRKDTSA